MHKIAPVRSAAIITDIHGNLPALEAALARVEEIGPDAVYCGGDLVGYGPWPNEVCRVIEEREMPTIYGNYDHAIARDEDDCRCAYVTERDRELGQRSVEWTLSHTDRRSKDFMRELPFDLRFELGGRRVRLVDGSPLFVNCGSVGKPKDGDPRGAFAVLEEDGEGVAARIERFDYDAGFASREVAAAGLPGEFAEKLLIAA